MRKRLLRVGSVVCFGALVVVAATACTGGSSGGGQTTSSAPRPSSEAPDTHVAASSTSEAAEPSGIPPLPQGWVETELSVDTALGTIYGSFTHPVAGAPVPAALVIGGSGPVDRDGNQPPAMPSMNTLLAVSRWLAAEQVASYRYDKLGSGKTALGSLTADTSGQVTYTDYLTMNAALLTALATQPGVDVERLTVVGHSEGGLFALALGAGEHGQANGVPAVRGVASLQGLSKPILTVIGRQVHAQIDAAVSAGSMTDAQGQQYAAALDAAIAAVRAGQSVPGDTPAALAAAFPASALTYLRTEDAVDPATVAAALPAGMPLLTSCSDADIQVECSEVESVVTAAREAGSAVTEIKLTGVSHLLKEDASKDPARYGDDLPFSETLQAAVSAWLAAANR